MWKIVGVLEVLVIYIYIEREREIIESYFILKQNSSNHINQQVVY